MPSTALLKLILIGDRHDISIIGQSPNVPIPSITLDERIVTADKEEQSLKARFPTVFIFGGKDNSFNTLQSQKVSSPIEFKVAGNSTFSKDEQPLKASLPIFVNDEGNAKFFKEVQL